MWVVLEVISDWGVSAVCASTPAHLQVNFSHTCNFQSDQMEMRAYRLIFFYFYYYYFFLLQAICCNQLLMCEFARLH